MGGARSSRLQRIVLLVLAALVVLVALLWCAMGALFGLPCKLQPFTEVSKVDVGNDRLVTIYVDTCWEVGYNVRYDVSEAGKSVIPITALSFRSSGEFGMPSGLSNFKVAYAENQSLIAVYDSTSSDLFIIIDFTTHTSWPTSCVDEKKCDEAKNKAWALFERLRRETPDLPKPRNLSP
jgi:hypothetical protein